jgi:hypothetical protein
MDRRKDFAHWNIPAPKMLDEALEQALVFDTHSTKADFVRDAVRRRLEEMGFKPRPFENAQTASIKTIAEESSARVSANHTVSLNEVSRKGQTKTVKSRPRNCVLLPVKDESSQKMTGS